jgi:hypothetical protein
MNNPSSVNLGYKIEKRQDKKEFKREHLKLAKIHYQ